MTWEAPDLSISRARLLIRALDFSELDPDPCRETSEGAVHGSHGISQGARKLARTPKVIKKKKKISVNWERERKGEGIEGKENGED